MNWSMPPSVCTKFTLQCFKSDYRTRQFVLPIYDTKFTSAWPTDISLGQWFFGHLAGSHFHPDTPFTFGEDSLRNHKGL